MQSSVEVISEARQRGVAWREIAEWFHTTEKAVQGRYYRAVKPQHRGLPRSVRGVPVEAVLDLPVRPFAVPVAAPAAPVEVDIVRALIFGDTHKPYHCAKTLDVVKQLVQDFKPTHIAHNGDLLDCYDLSRFDQDPKRLYSLQDEINLARAELHQIAQLAPNARRVFFEGNHEDRLRRTVWQMQGAARALASLDEVQNVLTWPRLLQLDAIGWEFVPYMEQSRFAFLPKFIVKHGDRVHKWSGWTARNEWMQYGKSGCSGHTHRLGMFMHRDHNGNHAWFETGCTCTLDPTYKPDPDWQNGLLLIEFERSSGAFAAQPVYIHNGWTVWQGKKYRG